MNEKQPTGPLAGLRVLEMGSIIAGPFAGRLLGDLGADVIKIEAPDHPDPLRDWGQIEYKGVHLMWTVLARNKKCITLNLHSAEGRILLRRLVQDSDVLIENFRPGTLEKWDLAPEDLLQLNPGLVIARVSGYGQTGPYAQRPGFASVAEGLSGLRYLNGSPGGPPPRMGLSIGDSLAGLFAVQGVLAALVERNVSGQGQVIDVALTDSCLAMTESLIPEYSASGHIRQPSGTRLDGIAPSNLYKCSDGKWVIIAANQDTLFARLCHAMQRSDLIEDERFATHIARGKNQNEIDDIVAAWVAQFPIEKILEILKRFEVVAGPIHTVADVVEEEQFKIRDMLVAHFDERIGETVLGPGVVPKFSRTPGEVRWSGRPVPGADNQEVYSSLGLRDADLLDLRREGVV